MADDVTVDNVALTDYKVVADEVTSPYAGTAGLAQGVKILDGTANGTQPVPATTANGLLVDVSRITGTVTVSGAVAVSGTVTVDSELPAAAALTDNFANPTAPAVGAFNMGWDGSAWDRIRADGGSVFIQDGGNSITVDAPVGTPVNVKVGDGTNTAGIKDVGAADALMVAIVDGSGTQITSFGGGTQYDEDTAHVSGDKVTLAGVVQQSADAALSNDGDRSLLQVDASGYLKVNVKAGGTSGTQYTEADTDASITGTAMMWEDTADTLRAVSVSKPLPVSLYPAGLNAGPVFGDDTAYVTAADALMAIGMIADDTSTDSVNENDIGIPRMTLDRKQLVRVVGATDTNRLDITSTGAAKATLVDSVGDSVMNDTANSVRVSVIGDLTSITDDEVFNPGSSGIAMMGAFADEAATDSVNEGDGGALRMTLDRKLLTRVVGSTDSSRLEIGSEGAAYVQGPAAHAAAAVGNPVYAGGRASSALPTDVGADADVAAFWLNRNGAQFVKDIPHFGMIADPYTLNTATVTATTAQTGTAVWTPTSTKRLVITYIQIQIGGTTAATVQVWFESSNGDTTYTRNTDDAIFDGEFAPSATLKPGFAQTGLWIAQGADFDLRYTTSANITITITVWGYEI